MHSQPQKPMFLCVCVPRQMTPMMARKWGKRDGLEQQCRPIISSQNLKLNTRLSDQVLGSNTTRSPESKRSSWTLIEVLSNLSVGQENSLHTSSVVPLRVISSSQTTHQDLNQSEPIKAHQLCPEWSRLCGLPGEFPGSWRNIYSQWLGWIQHSSSVLHTL